MSTEGKAQLLMNQIDRILRKNPLWDLDDTDDRIEMHRAILPLIREALVSRSDETGAEQEKKS